MADDRPVPPSWNASRGGSRLRAASDADRERLEDATIGLLAPLHDQVPLDFHRLHAALRHAIVMLRIAYARRTSARWPCRRIRTR
ncbi:hypothetical protein AQJ58_14500 [Streptomyces sp. DSM 15324]|nr:hypothetical protein AQJ58_14500 [Streptomyces sp. DSM 15324]